MRVVCEPNGKPLKSLCHSRASCLPSLDKERLGKDPGKAGVGTAEERRKENRSQCHDLAAKWRPLN